MKKIAVLIHSLTTEYSIEVLNGVIEFFKDKDVQLFIGPVKNPHTVIGIYEYQNWTSKNLLSTDEIDGTLVISGSFASQITTEELSEQLKDFSSKPMVSISADLQLQNCPYTKSDCKSTYKDIIKHLVQDHKCKKIAFFSAHETGSAEAIERFEAYKEGLAFCNLDFDENLILNGMFTSSSAYAATKEKYPDKGSINFDAILAANDLMAVGLIKALKELGVRIPEDVKVIGFDDTSHAANCTPSLSTINQGIAEHGRKGAELLYKKLNNEDTPDSIMIPVIPIMRQSCGCMPADIMNSNSYKNLQNQLCVKNSGSINSGITFTNFLSKLDDVYNLFDMVKSGTSLKQLFFSMKFLMDIADISHLAICFYESPVTIKRDDDYKLPTTANISMFVDKIKNIKLFEPGISFNPARNLLPDEYIKDIPGNYILNPIFSGETNYGYMICRAESDLLSIYPLILKIFINTIAQTYEYTQLKSSNKELNLQNKTDELTKILNRRGFMDIGQKTIEISLETDNRGLVFFIDMDGLKTINDTYGHKMGDQAIKAQSTVLKKALRANDIVGRLSGDEFAIIAPGLTLENIPKIKSKIKSLSKKISEEKNFPFTISCSFGAVEFNKDTHELNMLLANADTLLYVEKRKKHSKNK